MGKYKKLIVRCCIGAGILIFVINIILFLFYLFLNSDYMRKDYVSAQSECGKWSVYLLPDTYGDMTGFLVYEGNELDTIDIKVDTDNEKGIKETIIKEAWMLQLDHQFLTVAGKNVLNGKPHYCILQSDKSDTKMKVSIYWHEKGEQMTTNLSVEYNKVNLYSIYTNIWYYCAFGWLFGRTW